MVAVTFTTPEDRLDEKTGLFEKIIDTLELYTAEPAIGAAEPRH